MRCRGGLMVQVVEQSKEKKNSNGEQINVRNHKHNNLDLKKEIKVACFLSPSLFLPNNTKTFSMNKSGLQTDGRS